MVIPLVCLPTFNSQHTHVIQRMRKEMDSRKKRCIDDGEVELRSLRCPFSKHTCIANNERRKGWKI